MDALAQFFFGIVQFIDVVVVPFIFTIAFVVFLWGVFRFFIAGAADEEKRKEGRKFVLWGIIGFVLMFTIWGIVVLIINSLGFDTRTRPELPLFGPAGFQGQFERDNGVFTNPNGSRTTGTGEVDPDPTTRDCRPFNGGFFQSCRDGFDCVNHLCVNRDGS